MRLSLLRNAALGLMAITALSAAAESFEVTLTEVGTLSENIPADKKYTITDLKISGPLNGTDLKFLRDMLGVNEMWKATDGKLVNLDMTDATLHEGGSYYMAADGSQATTAPVWIYSRNDALPEELFSGTKLETIQLPTSIKGIYSSFSDAKFLKGDIIVPEGIQFIGEWAFAGSSIEGILLPNSLHDGPNKYYFNGAALGGHAFQGCTHLRAIRFPAGVTMIKGQTFAGCTALKDFYIPASITELEAEFISNCTSLESIYAEALTPAKAEYRAFAGVDFDKVTVYVPANARSAYESADEWSEFKNIEEEGSTSLEMTAAEVLTFDTAARTLYTAGKTAEVFTAEGRLVARGSDLNLASLTKGVYVAVCNGAVIKFSL